MEAREPLRDVRGALRAVLARLREGEPGEGREPFELPRFWDALGQTFQVTSQEATKLSLAFSRPPLPSAEDCRKLCEDVQNAILAVATVYYWLPKGQGTTLRKMVRDATTEVVEGMIQLTDTILNAPVESLSQEQLISTGGVWEACEQVSNLPRNNQAAVVSALTVCLGVVKDAVEEMEHVRKTLSLRGTCSGGFIESEYSELEGIHKDHRVQLLSLAQDNPNKPTMCLRVLSKCSLNSGRFGAVTASLRNLFQCPTTLYGGSVIEHRDYFIYRL